MMLPSKNLGASGQVFDSNGCLILSEYRGKRC